MSDRVLGAGEGLKWQRTSGHFVEGNLGVKPTYLDADDWDCAIVPLVDTESVEA